MSSCTAFSSVPEQSSVQRMSTFEDKSQNFGTASCNGKMDFRLTECLALQIKKVINFDNHGISIELYSHGLSIELKLIARIYGLKMTVILKCT